VILRSMWRPIGVVLLVSTALAACAKDVPKEAAGPESSNQTTSAASGGLSVAEKIVNEPEARKDVTLAGCAAQDGGWKAAGRIKNSKKESMAYTIVVSFTNEKSTVLARATERVTVAAGKSRSWESEARFKAPEGVVCVLRGVDRG
jgi:hypothetical protein